MNLQLTITDAGRQALVNADNSGTLPLVLSEIRLGSGQYTPAANQASLQNETKTLNTFSGDVVGPDTLHLTIRDESPDVYTLNEFGLYTDGGILFALYSSPNSTVLEKSAGGIVLLSIDIAFTTLDVASLSFGNTDFLLPPGTTETAGLLQLADNTEALAGDDTEKAMTPHTVNLVLAEHESAATAHSWSQIGNKPDQATRWPAWGELTGKPTVYPSSSHGHLKSEVGLPNVDNTADADKPLSTATQAALDNKLDHDTPAVSAPIWTTARTLGVSLSGDVTGSASVSVDGSTNNTISISATINDDSHHHTIANVDGLQAVLDSKLQGGAKAADSHLLDGYDSSAFIRSFIIEDGDGTEVSVNHGNEIKFVEGTGIDINWTDTSTGSDTDPYDLTFSVASAPRLTTARTIALSGDLSGSASFDGSRNITINAGVNDDSHNHTLANVDGLQAALDGKVSMGGTAANSQLLDGYDSSAFIRSFIIEDGDGTEVSINQGNDIKFVEGTGIDINWTDTSTGSNADPYDLTFRVVSAPKLTTARTIALGGDLSGSASFNGASNITLSAGVNDDSHNHIVANVDGLQSALDSKWASALANGYYGFSIPNGGGTSDWIRTTVNGFLPYSSGGASALGTSGWPFSSIYGNNIYQGGSKVIDQNDTLFVIEDGDGTERSFAGLAKEWKFTEGNGIDINWTDTSTGSDADPYDLTFTVTNSPKLNGYSESTGNGGNTIARRDSSGDINARLLRSSYANQTTFSGAMAYRVSATDNYIRYCSNPSAVKNWLNSQASEIDNSSNHLGASVEDALNKVPEFSIINQTLQSSQNQFFNNIKARGMRLRDPDTSQGTVHLNIRVNVNASGAGDDVTSSGALSAAYRPNEPISFVLTQVNDSTNYYYLHGQIQTNGRILLWEATGIGAYSENGVFHGHVVYFFD